MKLKEIKIGGLYSYPFEVLIRGKNSYSMLWIEPGSLFMVLEEIKSQSGSWLHVLTSNGHVGYVGYSRKFLQPISKR